MKWILYPTHNHTHKRATMKTRNTPEYTMVFDTETTGLPLKKKDYLIVDIYDDEDKRPTATLKGNRELNSIFDFSKEEPYPVKYSDIYCLDKQPYMTQLSFIVLDNRSNIVFQFNNYLKIPLTVEISDFITRLTGITREKTNSGMDTAEALEIFIHWFLKCDRIVAHNIEFDRTIIRTEVMRNYDYLKQKIPYIDIVFSNRYDKITNLDHYDTMIRGNKRCNIQIPKKDGEGTRLKVPKLSEMYQIFFHQTPTNLHNSFVDILATMRCYLKLKYHRNLDDSYFDDLIKKAVNGENICGPLVTV